MKSGIRVAIAIWAIGFFALPIYGLFFPSDAHIEGLKKETSELELLSGMGGGEVSCNKSSCDHSKDYSQRSYFTFPSSLLSGRVIFINVYHNGDVEAESADYIAYLLLLFWVASIWYSLKWVKSLSVRE